MGENITQAKDKLRRQIRHARRALSIEQQQQAARQAAARAIELPHWQQINHVAAYLANDGELDPAPLISQLWQRNKRSYLPRLHPFHRGYLLFQHYHPGSELISNRFGIAEPRLDVRSVLPPAKLDMILLPLVAFDARGNRLGMGGGFYDRTLSAADCADKLPLLVGYAHDVQCVDELPVEPWDHPLSAVITPSKVYRFD